MREVRGQCFSFFEKKVNLQTSDNRSIVEEKKKKKKKLRPLSHPGLILKLAMSFFQEELSGVCRNL